MSRNCTDSKRCAMSIEYAGPEPMTWWKTALTTIALASMVISATGLLYASLCFFFN